MMMKLVLFFCLGLGLSRIVAAQSLELVGPQGSQSISLKDLKAKLKTVKVFIDDPVYTQPKEYDAFALSEILTLAGLGPTEHADELILTAADGYAPTLSFEMLKNHKAFLAYQEHESPGRFSLLQVGKASVSPWPFYLIWDEGAKLKEVVPWPYQLVKIEVVDWKKVFGKILPPGSDPNSEAYKGFGIFKAQCLRCHSINLVGGEVGPELNSPQNVTEYWKSDVLRKFIKNAPSFHLKSKMPEFSHLSEGDIDHIIAYLRAMRKVKITEPKG